MIKIFVNYRSQDEPFGAKLLDQELSTRFGSDVVFRDSKSIRPGEDFTESILEAVRNAAALLVVIGPRWRRPTPRAAGCWTTGTTGGAGRSPRPSGTACG